MSKRRNNIILENVLITDIASEGNAIAKVDNMVVFVPKGIPGDVVNIQITRKRKSYMEGNIIEIITPSSIRIEPFCSHFGVCGGCKWQHLPYSEQLKYKQKQVIDNFERIGKITINEILPIFGSAKTQYYRNKLEYTFSHKRWLTKEEIHNQPEFLVEPGLGFHIPGMFDKVLDVAECFLQPDLSNKIRQAIRSYALQNNLEFFDLRNQNGFLRNLIIRNNSKNEWMVTLSLFYEDTNKRESILQFLKKEFPEITSLNYVINEKANDTISDLDVVTYAGSDHILEEMEGLNFRIGPKSFYQTNSEQAYELYCITRNFAGLTGNEIVYDLYTGTGTIALFLSGKASKVVGIEYVPESIEDAKLNMVLNGIANTSFFAGDMKDVLVKEFIDIHGKPDVMIVDPPRAGMHDKVIEAIKYAAPKRIVYVSCNPATQARDINLLSDMYHVEKIQTVDMFPHTHHVENVALLIRN